MYVEQIYTNCLAEASYYIESDGEAVVIDPIRETEPYLDKAAQRGTKIKYVLETHFHADFVSGHIDLAKKAGATIVFGPLAETGYKVHQAKDGEILKVGKIKIKVLHTPGHTPESSSYLLFDEDGKEYAIFTGDTLFVGDVGRPDLLDGKMSKEELASMLYDSLNQKIKPLHDEVILYPGHGPGSSCGKNIGKETVSTIGEQKKSNYALQEMSRKEFIETITSGLKPPPPYFFMDARINKTGYTDIDEVMKRNLKGLDPSTFQTEMAAGALVLDTRDKDDFEEAFIPGAVFIGLDGSFAVWVGTLLKSDRPILIVAEPGKEEEAILRLARVGYENVKGFLQGGIEVWKKARQKVDQIQNVNAKSFAIRFSQGELNVLDVRSEGEYNSAHVSGAQHVCLTGLPDSMDQLGKENTYYVHCKSGYRSLIAVTLLKNEGFEHVVNIEGGFDAISRTKAPISSTEKTIV